MIKLLRNKCNGRASSSPQKLKFSGAPVSIYIIDTKQSPCEGGSLPERDEERGVNLALRVNEDATEEENEASEGENKCGYKLQVCVHVFCEFFCKYILKKGRFANLTPLIETKMYF